MDLLGRLQGSMIDDFQQQTQSVRNILTGNKPVKRVCFIAEKIRRESILEMFLP